jgi:hypothetical protein
VSFVNNAVNNTNDIDEAKIAYEKSNAATNSLKKLYSLFNNIKNKVIGVCNNNFLKDGIYINECKSI